MAEKINARKVIKNKIINISSKKKQGADAQSESQITANAVMKGLTVKPAATPTISNKLMADQIAAKLNAKLGHVPLDRDENSSVRQVWHFFCCSFSF